MLHLIVSTHGPETCPASRAEVREKYWGEVGRMHEIAASHKVKIQGGWSNMPGHAFYVIVDAPNAHAVNAFAAEMRLMDWSTVDVQPVVTLDEAIANIGARETR
jgi:hypothetical protein